MDIKSYIEKLINCCNQSHIEDVEVYYSFSSSTSISVYKGEVKSFTLSNNEGINIGGSFNGDYSVTYIEKFDEASINEAIRNIKQTAPFNKKNKKSSKKSASACENGYASYNADIDSVIEKLKRVERKAQNSDKRIISVPGCDYYENNTKILIYDDKGAVLEDSYTYTMGSVTVVAMENDIKKNGHAFSIEKSFEDINYDSILSEAVNKATTGIHAAPIPSGSYEVILKNSVAADMFSVFMSIFSADALKKNTSKLAGKSDTKIAFEGLNIVEDPMYLHGKINRRFDDEGVKTYKKYLVKNGVLKSILSSNEYEASTGNAFRDSYKTNIAVSALNGYIEKGSISTNEMIAGMTDGVIITSVDGINAGMNVSTGDFSLISNGFYIKNGIVEKPINQITIAGNFYDLLNDIVSISNDVSTSEPYINFFESPSLLIKGIMIGGL